MRARQKDIAELAKQIWENDGRQAGRDLEYWLRAERELRATKNWTSKAPTSAGTALHI